LGARHGGRGSEKKKSSQLILRILSKKKKRKGGKEKLVEVDRLYGELGKRETNSAATQFLSMWERRKKGKPGMAEGAKDKFWV